MFTLFEYDMENQRRGGCLGMKPSMKVAAKTARDFQYEGRAVLMLFPDGTERLYPPDLADRARFNYRVRCSVENCPNWRFPSWPSRHLTEQSERTCSEHHKPNPRSIEALVERNQAGRGRRRGPSGTLSRATSPRERVVA